MVDWKQAQADVLERLAEVQRHIDAKDESSVLELINQQDAFCEAAIERQEQVAENHCHFCEGFKRGGCMSRLDAIDHAVLHAEWETATRLVDEYRRWVESIDLS